MRDLQALIAKAGREVIRVHGVAEYAAIVGMLEKHEQAGIAKANARTVEVGQPVCPERFVYVEVGGFRGELADILGEADVRVHFVHFSACVWREKAESFRLVQEMASGLDVDAVFDGLEEEMEAIARGLEPGDETTGEGSAE